MCKLFRLFFVNLGMIFVSKILRIWLTLFWYYTNIFGNLMLWHATYTRTFQILIRTRFELRFCLVSVHRKKCYNTWEQQWPKKHSKSSATHWPWHQRFHIPIWNSQGILVSTSSCLVIPSGPHQLVAQFTTQLPWTASHHQMSLDGMLGLTTLLLVIYTYIYIYIYK